MATKANANGEAFIVRTAQDDGVFISAIMRGQIEQAKVTQPIPGNTMVFRNNLMVVEAQGISDQINQAIMGNSIVDPEIWTRV